MQSLGFTSAIDDFGTGYSSLSYLKELSVNVLKIDRSFIKDIETDNDSAAITKDIVNLGHGLGVQVVAEGVDTKEHLTLFAELGCDLVQGYYFSKPIPAKQLLDFAVHYK